MSGQVNYLVEAPELGQEYYCLFVFKHPLYVVLKWRGKDYEKRLLAMHRFYPTKEDLNQAGIFVYNFFISNKEQLNYLTSEPEPGTEVWYGMEMDDEQFDIASKIFDPKDDSHQRLYNRSYLYKTCEDLIKAMNLIKEALEEEYKKAH